MKKVFLPAVVMVSGLLLAGCAHDRDMKAADQQKHAKNTKSYQSGYSAKLGKKRSYSY